MKCFERSAEKCHVDSLSSIVASCSWGKHVAIGTGTRFQLLWNEKEVSLNVHPFFCPLLSIWGMFFFFFLMGDTTIIVFD